MEEELMKNERLIFYVLKKMNLLHEADELYDVALIGMVKAIDKYDSSKGKLSTFLCAAIRNEITSELSYRCRQKRGFGYLTCSLDTEIDEDGTTLKEVIVTDYNIEDEMIKNEQLQDLNNAIDKLKEKHKVIILHYFGLRGYEQLNQVQIAKKYGWGRSDVSCTYKRALKKLKKLLEEKVKNE